MSWGHCRRFVLVLSLLTLAGLAPARQAPPVHSPDDLAQAAVQATPEAAKLFAALATPFDLVEFKDGERWEVEPVPRWLGGKPKFEGEIELRPRAAARGPRQVTSAALARLTPYETWATDQVRQFLTGADPLQADHLPRFEAAEAALQAVLGFHLARRSHPAGGDDPWRPVTSNLEKHLRAARLAQLHIRAGHARQAADWQAALTLAERLTDTYPHDPLVSAAHVEVRALLGSLAILDRGDYAEARRHWLRIEELAAAAPPPLFALAESHLPPAGRWLGLAADADALRGALEARARQLAAAADGLPATKARDKLLEAAALWPGLRDRLHRLDGTHAILRVGVRGVPFHLLPATARSDADRLAASLLFEPLVRPVLDPDAGQVYLPRLAADLPAADAAGVWRVTLRRHAYWSDGRRVAAADVVRTLQLLKKPAGWPAGPAAIQESLPQGDFRLHLTSPFAGPDPLAVFAFPVLPARFRGQPLPGVADAAFAREPVSNGPFAFDPARNAQERSRLVLTANPHYQRPDARPVTLREIHFHAPKNLESAFSDPKEPVHVLIDVPTQQLPGLEKAGAKIHTLYPRRVHFLAVNHDQEPLPLPALRRLLAHAVRREETLGRHFHQAGAGPSPAVILGGVAGLAFPGKPGAGIEKSPHRALNGPYPPGTWAVAPAPPAPAPAVPASLDNAELARTFALAVKKQHPVVTLTLKCPDDDARVPAACRDLAAQASQVAKQAGLDLRLEVVPLPPGQLRDALDRGDYQLAYTHYDFPDESYPLWPLFDTGPVAPGAANVLRYRGDAELERLLRTIQGHRDFAKVKALTHELHAHLYEQMPLIPLWQLALHVAAHPDLATTALDPNDLFADVTSWKWRGTPK